MIYSRKTVLLNRLFSATRPHTTSRAALLGIFWARWESRQRSSHMLELISTSIDEIRRP